MASNKKTKTAALDALFRAVCGYFGNAFEKGTATTADVKNAIQFLKDNGINAMLSEENPEAPLNKLTKAAEESGTIQFPFPVVSSNLLDKDDPAVKAAGSE
ncbi:MAG: hypothetical protein LUG50_06855 [Planctomycetaceae bacterium]|nr:hypothetical protein [Planctomycetaceae bacterium]